MKKIIILILISLLVPMLSFASIDQPSTWATESVENLEASNMLKDEVFHNYKYNITRKEFIYLAVRLYETIKGSGIIVDKSISFKDTNDIYALKGATIGITNGIGNGNFGPKVLITREQLAVLLVNTMKLAGAELKEAGQYRFNDENKFAEWSKDAIYLAQANGIVNGVGNDQFNGKGNATTEVAMIIVNKILENGHYEGKSELQLRFENKELSFVDALKQYPMSDRLILEINRVSSWYDYDGDGLLDYEEVYRNFTNPNKPDTDGDGILDGDWNERREYTYALETELRLFPPYNLEFMKSHLYQDVYVIEQTAGYVDIKLLLYPYNTFYKTVIPNPNWKKDNLTLIGKMTPGLRNDWDDQMQKDLIEVLLEYKINPDELTDIDLVYRVIELFDGDLNKFTIADRSEAITGDSAFHMYDWYIKHNEDGTYQLNLEALKNRSRVSDEINQTIKDMVKRFDMATGQSWNEARILSLIASSKADFYEKYHGSCSSTSEFYANIFQALGIPTKVLPYQTVLDTLSSDYVDSNELLGLKLDQVEKLVDKRIKSDMKSILLETNGGSNHVTNLIFVGNRWINIDIAGGQKFNNSLFDQKRLVFFKNADYDYSKTQEKITEIWLQSGFNWNYYKGLLESKNFDSTVAKHVTNIGNFAQITYSIEDQYGKHMSEETMKFVNAFNDATYQSCNGRYELDYRIELVK